MRKLLKMIPRNFSEVTRTHGGLKDQDRIFTNVYNDGSACINGAQKRGDWHRTKDILTMG